MGGTHALLSPSAAHRWMNCTASARLEEKAPDKESEYALEGTLAHAYCAKKLKGWLGEPTDAEDSEIALLAPMYHTGEMDEHTDAYAAIVMEKLSRARIRTRDARLRVETRLSFGGYVPEAHGTADAMIITDGTMEVLDFKYGKGVRVSAVRNPQMMIYALGAYLAHSFEYRIERVRMTIVQPRIDNLSEWEVSVRELRHWATTELKPRAEAAYLGEGEPRPGEWCQFCKVKGRCRALARECAEDRGDPRLLAPEELARDVLPRLAMIKAWCASVEEHCLEQALSGVAYPGYKLVEGRSVRKITDPEAVAAAFAREGYDQSEYMKPAQLCGISELERLAGKKRFAELCAGLVDKPPGKPTLVSEDDKRPAYNAAATDFNGIDA